MIYFGYFSFSTIHLELKRQIRLYAPVVPLKTMPDLRPQWSKSIPVFRPKQLKNSMKTDQFPFYLAVNNLQPSSLSIRPWFKAQPIGVKQAQQFAKRHGQGGSSWTRKQAID